ncbi:hypothetical protein [Bacteroides sp.]|uniref:hypothetical protein n=1 Tax=Bacteroides sp. TaxID=29523 RepID=UPI0026344B38|nr:hypothetical protein [Bacteroides sp.]MDD3037058.1 hypothetical protein [Bacteroides sp.]
MIAKDIVLKFSDALNNALFLLRDIDRGKEETVFICQDDKQFFLSFCVWAESPVYDTHLG